TPPVCLAAYAGAGIARATPFKTGVTAVKLAIAAFIIPYIFMLNPILVLVDVTAVKLIIAIATALLGMAAVSSSLIGFFIRRSKVLQGVVLFAAGFLLVIAELATRLSGIALLEVMWVIQQQRDDDRIDPSKQTAQAQ